MFARFHFGRDLGPVSRASICEYIIILASSVKLSAQVHQSNQAEIKAVTLCPLSTHTHRCTHARTARIIWSRVQIAACRHFTDLNKLCSRRKLMPAKPVASFWWKMPKKKCHNKLYPKKYIYIYSSVAWLPINLIQMPFGQGKFIHI